MANSFTFYDVSFSLNNGQTLFDQLSGSIGQRITGLVGPNGCGKSVLAQVLAGQLQAASGQIVCNQTVHYVPQQWQGDPHDLVEDVLGITPALRAIESIEAGSAVQQDFDTAEAWWDWQTTLTVKAKLVGFRQLPDLKRSISSFSGGEQFRIMWLTALINDADILIFDEPTNHLDQHGRTLLFSWLAHTSQQIVLVSHDRDLLNLTDEIFEITAHHLHVHSGKFDDYFSAKHQRWDQQQSSLSQARKAKKSSANKAQEAFEKQQQRAANGKARAKKENWTKMDRDAAKESAENSLGKQLDMRAQRKAGNEESVASAQQALEWFEPIGFELPDSSVSNSKLILQCSNLAGGFDHSLHPPVELLLTGPSRIHITGANGSGKSVLLKILMGRQQPLTGNCKMSVPYAYLGQHFNEFNQTLSAVDNFQNNDHNMTEKECRDRLAWLRLRNKKADVPFGQLSGGEQLKAALAIKLLGKTTPQLLLLDEPTNHLDLDSTIALERALAQFKGALVLVSHDQYFVNKLAITQRLDLETATLQIV